LPSPVSKLDVLNPNLVLTKSFSGKSDSLLRSTTGEVIASLVVEESDASREVIFVSRDGLVAYNHHRIGKDEKAKERSLTVFPSMLRGSDFTVFRPPGPRCSNPKQIWSSPDGQVVLCWTEGRTAGILRLYDTWTGVCYWRCSTRSVKNGLRIVFSASSRFACVMDEGKFFVLDVGDLRCPPLRFTQEAFPRGRKRAFSHPKKMMDITPHGCRES